MTGCIKVILEAAKVALLNGPYAAVISRMNKQVYRAALDRCWWKREDLGMTCVGVIREDLP
jgi:hypothetical protein